MEELIDEKVQEYPIYLSLGNFQCEKCKVLINEPKYSMVWRGKCYCAGCALEMKASGEVVDKALVEVFPSDEELKGVSCSKRVNHRGSFVSKQKELKGWFD
jgi:hypothetical protein